MEAIIAETLACLLANTCGVSVETELRMLKQRIRESYKRFSSKHTPSSMLEKLLVVFPLFLASLTIIYSIQKLTRYMYVPSEPLVRMNMSLPRVVNKRAYTEDLSKVQ